jgi:hypothetical protein
MPRRGPSAGRPINAKPTRPTRDKERVRRPDRRDQESCGRAGATRSSTRDVRRQVASRLIDKHDLARFPCYTVIDGPCLSSGEQTFTRPFKLFERRDGQFSAAGDGIAGRDVDGSAGVPRGRILNMRWVRLLRPSQRLRNFCCGRTCLLNRSKCRVIRRLT